MTEGLKRFYGRQDLHFVTFSCYQRLPLLGSVQARNLVVEELSRVRREYQFSVVGYVVMPNHVHLLLSEPARGTPSTVLQIVKQSVSHKMRRSEILWNETTQIQPSKIEGAASTHDIGLNSLPRFWQPRFYDFNVYSHEKKNDKLEYMHANPVSRGLVQHPKDWSWSSFSFYNTGEQGIVPIDPVNL